MLEPAEGQFGNDACWNGHFSIDSGPADQLAVLGFDRFEDESRAIRQGGADRSFRGGGRFVMVFGVLTWLRSSDADHLAQSVEGHRDFPELGVESNKLFRDAEQAAALQVAVIGYQEVAGRVVAVEARNGEGMLKFSASDRLGRPRRSELYRLDVGRGDLTLLQERRLQVQGGLVVGHDPAWDDFSILQVQGGRNQVIIDEGLKRMESFAVPLYAGFGA